MSQVSGADGDLYPALRSPLCRPRQLAAAITLVSLAGLSACGFAGSPTGSNSIGGGGPATGGPAAGLLAASATSLSFGNVAVGTSTVQTLTLTNTGGSNVNISSMSITGSGLSVSGTTAALGPNQSVTISVNFAPTAADATQGNLSVSSNASNPALEVAVSGTGVVPIQHVVNLTWLPSTSAIVGYFVYRANAAGSTTLKLNSSPNPSTAFTDNTVTSGETYMYSVTSIDSDNVESAPSNQVTVTVPSP